MGLEQIDRLTNPCLPLPPPPPKTPTLPPKTSFVGVSLDPTGKTLLSDFVLVLLVEFEMGERWGRGRDYRNRYPPTHPKMVREQWPTVLHQGDTVNVCFDGGEGAGVVCLCIWYMVYGILRSCAEWVWIP